MTKTDAQNIAVFNESGKSIPMNSGSVEKIANLVFEGEEKQFNSLEIVYLDEKGITEINKKHLQHNSVTDVITFYYHEPDTPVEGTIFCCAQQIFEQSVLYGTKPEAEFSRVLIHGMLHLCGYDDKTSEQKSIMTAKEDEYLDRL